MKIAAALMCAFGTAGFATSAATSGAPAPPISVADLPLIIVPAQHHTYGAWFGIFLSGDGGWARIDRAVSDVLAKHDIPIVGWDSLKYFWSPRTPESAARDLDRVIRHFSARWGRAHVLLIGFSQGADTLPFMLNRLPPSSREMVGLTALLGVSDTAVWEVHVGNLLGHPAPGMPTAPEFKDWRGAPYVCLYGESDADAACARVAGGDGIAVKMPGGHHFGSNYRAVAREILSRLPMP